MSSGAKLWLRPGIVGILGERLVHVVVVDETDVDLAAADGGDDGVVVGERDRVVGGDALQPLASSPRHRARCASPTRSPGTRRSTGRCRCAPTTPRRSGRGRSAGSSSSGMICGLKARTRWRPERPTQLPSPAWNCSGTSADGRRRAACRAGRVGRGSRRRPATATGRRRRATGRPPPRSAGRGRTCCRSAPRRRCPTPRRSGRGSA